MLYFSQKNTVRIRRKGRISMTFAERLMTLRRAKGWSQEELGERLGVTRQTVSKWELGSTTPELEKLSAMGELFGVSLDELVNGKQAALPEEKPPAAEKKKRFHYEYKSARTWRGMPLVHINIGFGRYVARGVVAIGNVALGLVALGFTALGVVACGFAAVGVIAFGLAAAGIAASGTCAVGVFAAGAIALGVFTAGGISTGWLAVGGLAAGKYAVGGVASGSIALGGTASGVIAVGDKVDGEIMITAAMKAEEFADIVAQRLPNTPQFIVRFFARLVETLN